jgi:tRNA/tmRNA/rRNA uracil-C5-methylase (TrmA/RlmC/RlmD family)
MKDPLQLSIVDVAFGGKGVARHDGKVYFVPFTAPGDVVMARIVRGKKNFAEAELISVEQASPHRVEPRCPYFGRCGGCAYQHIAYPEQLELKFKQVEQTLRRVGRMESVPMRPIVPSSQEYGYRNRIRVHAEAGVIGFYTHASHALIDVEQCPISMPTVNDALNNLRQRNVMDGDYTLSARERTVFFEQTNDSVAAELLAAVRNAIKPGQQFLLDAYSGAGFFAKGLADLFEQVIGIEENAYAVDQARTSATAKERYIVGDVQIHLGEVLATHDLALTTVILDPPAIGASSRVMEILSISQPEHLIYVSCNPATLARDISLLKGAYTLDSVTPFDMFPQTAEIEVMALLTASR